MSRRLTLPLLLIALLGLPGPGSARADEQVRSGPLLVRVHADPFALEFIDTSDGDVLRTLGGGLPSPQDPHGRYGPLGYSFDLRLPVINNAFLGYYAAAEAETLWFHGTALRSATGDARSTTLRVATNDPLGHELEVTLRPAGSGGMTVESRIAPGSGPLAGLASLSGAAFEAEDGERYLGFGERSNAVDQAGNRVFSWAEEGPFSSGNGEALLRPVAPGFTFPTGPTATNFPIPWLVSTRGIGVLIDQSERSAFNLRTHRTDAWQAEAEASSFRFTVFAGPDPAAVVRRYSAYAGRQPAPAPWIFGPWFQPTGETAPFELADAFRRDDVPVSVAQTYTHYLPCGAQVGQEAAERERVAGYHARGYRITTYFNPHVCTTYGAVYDRAAAAGWFVRDRRGEPYVVSNPFTADEQVSLIDFTNPGGVELFEDLLDDALAAGYDGWMEDFGEYVPTDSRFYDGRSGLVMHNRYPVLYHAASTAHTRGRAPGVFVRSGFHGVQPHARVVWGGDPTEDWSCADGLCAAVHQAINTGLSGIAYWGSDIGGFHAIVNGRTSHELNIRWLQLGAVSGVMRTQANGFSVRDNRADRSQVWHPEVLPVWRRYAKLRTQLYPYLRAASGEYRRTGMPIIRHLSLAYPDDPLAAAQQETFLFGPDLLAAPVIEPGATERSVYLPAGEWVDLWRSARYVPKTGALRLGRSALLTGGREVVLPAPLEELPMLARAGTILPLLPPEVDTLSGLGDRRGLVGLEDRAGRLDLLAFPRGTTTATFLNGESLASFEGRRAWLLEVDGRRARTYRLQASLRTLDRPFKPCTVVLDGRALGRRHWSYDRASGVLRATFRVRDGSLAVVGCRRG